MAESRILPSWEIQNRVRLRPSSKKNTLNVFPGVLIPSFTGLSVTGCPFGEKRGNRGQRGGQREFHLRSAARAGEAAEGRLPGAAGGAGLGADGHRGLGEVLVRSRSSGSCWDDSLLDVPAERGMFQWHQPRGSGNGISLFSASRVGFVSPASARSPGNSTRRACRPGRSPGAGGCPGHRKPPALRFGPLSRPRRSEAPGSGGMLQWFVDLLPPRLPSKLGFGHHQGQLLIFW